MTRESIVHTQLLIGQDLNRFSECELVYSTVVAHVIQKSQRNQVLASFKSHPAWLP